MRASLVVALMLSGIALADEVDAGAVQEVTPPPPVLVTSPCSPYVNDPFFPDSTKRDDLALPEGPASIGYQQADVAVGRRACPRTEVGLGGRFAAIIDVPNFYGNLGVSGILFGSYALNEKTELFATLEAVNYAYAVNASLEQTGLTLGNMTVGGTRVMHGGNTFVGSLSARVLLPTSFEIPGARLVGAEVSHLMTWVPFHWLALHSAVGVDFSAAFSQAQSFPRIGATALIGAELKPISWFAFVLDVTGHLGVRSYLAPTAALRFRVASLGIELGGSLPLVGTDRHDFIMGGRVSWRF